jgi:acyl-coenzyme A thioesterase PaaI-like protein
MANRSKLSISTDLSDGLCFGCGQKNPFGLKLNFTWDSSVARAEFTPTKFYQGWPGLLHGGIIATLLDEVMSYAVRFSGFDFVTAKMQTNFKRPIFIEEPLVITGSVTTKKGKLVETKASIFLPDGALMADGTGSFVIIESSSEETGSKEARS